MGRPHAPKHLDAASAIAHLRILITPEEILKQSKIGGVELRARTELSPMRWWGGGFRDGAMEQAYQSFLAVSDSSRGKMAGLWLGVLA